MEKYLYLFLDIATLVIPLLASFYPKHSYYKNWISLFKAIVIVAVAFLIWDAFFTGLGVWGFNATYLSGVFLGNLPIEEVLFFFCIPYSSVFVYFSMEYLLKKNYFKSIHHFISVTLILMGLVLLVFNYNKWYTASTFSLLVVYLVCNLILKRDLSLHYFAYSVTLVFFFIVNGVLTGSFISEPVVWYDDAQNLGVRLGTIPFEDVFYGFLLIALVIDFFNYFRNQKRLGIA